MPTHLLTLCALLLASAAAFAQGGAPNLLASLKPGHPRLICTDDDLARLKQLIQTDAAAAKYWADIRATADAMLGQPPIEHVLIGPRLLDKSRTCVDRVYTLGLTWRLTGEAKYAERAVTEMLTAAGFPDWNPAHFLDTAEMTHALGIGYDWLYSCMTADQRKSVREAIVRLGLEPGKKIYDEQGWWAKSEFNWNQVCNGGLGIGALAIADEEPDLCGYILSEGLKSFPLALKSYAPDGGWAEGPGYWHYATRYTVYYMAALESALRPEGPDYEVAVVPPPEYPARLPAPLQRLLASPGFDHAGLFRVHSCSPTGRTFNYADASEGAGSCSEMFWLARIFSQPLYAWHQRQCIRRAEALDLIWYRPEQISPQDARVPRDAYFTGVDAAFFRSAWEDPNAIFVGFKGGDNKANHSHLDLGCFVLDADGVRWAVDLGADDYNLPDYFGAKRWTYYRLVTESHNTLLINGQSQYPGAKAPLVAFGSRDDLAFAVADMTKAYPVMDKLLRGVALLDRKAVLVQDEVQAQEPVEALWGMVTFAQVQCDGPRATLTQSGKTLHARILSPAGAVFETVSANPPPPQHQQPDACRLVVRLPGKVEQARIAVLLSPGEADVAAPDLKPLAQWSEETPR